MKAKPITKEESEYIKSVLKYNPDTGIFTWKKSRTNKVKVGDVAGSDHGEGYVRIWVNYRRILAHRLAFLLMGEEVPEYVDHINGIKSDNRWCNLRGCNKSENSCNRKMRSDNTSGIRGLCKDKRSNKWEAYIIKEGKRTNLGYFNCVAHAACVRAIAEDKYFGEFVYKGAKK